MHKHKRRASSAEGAPTKHALLQDTEQVSSQVVSEASELSARVTPLIAVLNSQHSPLTEKLDLAKRIHTSSIFIPRKHQFLLDWLCSALLRDPDRLRFLEKSHPNESHATKVSHLSPVAWALLAELLDEHPPGAANPVPPKLLVSLSTALTRLDLSDNDCLTNLERVVSRLFSANFPFFPTTDHLVVALEGLIGAFFANEANQEQKLRLIDLYVHYLSAHITASNKRRKIFSLFATRLLVPLLQLLHWCFLKHASASLEGLSTLLGLALFPPGATSEFAAAFAGVATQENPGIRHYFLELFQAISDASKPDQDALASREAVMFSCGLLLEKFASATETDWSSTQRDLQGETKRSSQFGFFARLLYALHAHEPISASDVPLLHALRELLEKLAKLDISAPQSASALTALLASQLASISLDESASPTAVAEAAGALTVLALTDSPAVEAYLPSLLPVLWQGPYAASCAALLHLYGRLRQLDTFLQQVFAALLNSETITPSAFLPLVQSLSEATLQAPSGQLPQLWSVFSSHLERFTSSPSPSPAALQSFCALFCAFLDTLLPTETTTAVFLSNAVATLATLAPALGPHLSRLPKSNETLAPLLSLYTSLLRVHQVSTQMQSHTDPSNDDLFTFSFAAATTDLWRVSLPHDPFLRGVVMELRMRRLETLHAQRQQRSSNVVQHEEADATSGKRKKSLQSDDRKKEKKRSTKESIDDEQSDATLQRYANLLLEGCKSITCDCNVSWPDHWSVVQNPQEAACGTWRLQTAFFHVLAHYASDEALRSFLSVLLQPCSCFYTPSMKGTIGSYSHDLLSSASFYELPRMRTLVPVVLFARLPDALGELHLPSALIGHLKALASDTAPPPLSSWPKSLPSPPVTATGATAAEILQLLAALPRGLLSPVHLSASVFASTLCLLLTSPNNSPSSLEGAAASLFTRCLSSQPSALAVIPPAVIRRLLLATEKSSTKEQIASSISLYFQHIITQPSSTTTALSTLFDDLAPDAPSPSTLQPLTLLLHSCTVASPLSKQVQALVAQFATRYEALTTPLLSTCSTPLFAELGVLLRVHTIFRAHDAPPAALLASVVHYLRLAAPLVLASPLSTQGVAALRFINALCSAMHVISTRPHSFFLSSLFALIHRLLALRPNDAEVREAYDTLIANASHAGLSLALSLVRQELASTKSQRIAAALVCTQRLFAVLQGWRAAYVAKNVPSIISRLIQVPHSTNDSTLSSSAIAILTSFMAAPKRVAFTNTVSLLLSAFGPWAANSSLLDDRCFLALYGLLQTALRFRTKEVFRSIALFLRCLDVLLGAVTLEDTTLSAQCAENVTRLLEQLSSDAVQFRRYGVQVISSYIFALQRCAVKGPMKRALQPGIFAVINICTTFDYMQLARVLDSAGKSIWRSIYADYERDFRFKGKV